LSEPLIPEASPEIKAYFSKKKILLIDPQKSLRSTFKRVLRELGAEITSIEVVENDTAQAQNLIRSRRIEIILCPTMVNDFSAIDFHKIHQETIPNSLDRAFFIVSPQNSSSNATLVLDHQLDGCITEPFTAIGIRKSIEESLKSKCRPSAFAQAWEKLKADLEMNPTSIKIEDFETLENLEGVKQEKINLLKAIFYLKQNLPKEALSYLEQAHALDPKSYYPLQLLASTYSQLKMWPEAYTTRQTMLKNYPLNPEIIPELIKLSVVNEKFDDIFEYLKIFEQLEEKNPQLEKYIAAGLTLCGKFLLQEGDKERGVDALQKAVQFSHGQIEVIKTASTQLLEHGLFRASLEIIEEFKEIHFDNPDFQIVQLQILSQSPRTLAQAFKLGLELIARGHKRQEVYENVIKLAVKLKRKPEVIEDLVFDASKLFPDQAESFQKLTRT
jgi:tetratricopeptide (TPR) repeat protein